MQRYVGAACALASMLMLAACSQTPPAAPDTRAADERAIRDGEKTWSSDLASKDLDKIVGHYADDATLLIPDQPLAKGKDAIRNLLKQLMSDPHASLSFTTSAADVSKGGDIAYTQGAYSMTYTDPKTKRVVSEKGKYVTVYKKQADGSWKAVEDINNADAPATPENTRPARQTAAKTAKTRRKHK